MADEWKPKIIGIICNWCSYAGADGAGSARTQFPPDVRIVRVMCTLCAEGIRRRSRRSACIRLSLR